MRKLLLALTVVSGVAMAQGYPTVFDAVSEKHAASGFASLTEKEQAIYTIWWLEAEVNNGGFHQYFWNSSGDHTEIALKSLHKIGAIETASMLQRAIDVAFNGNVPASRIQRQNLLEIDEVSKIEKLGDLDSEFHMHPEEIHKMLDKYVSQ